MLPNESKEKNVLIRNKSCSQYLVECKVHVQKFGFFGIFITMNTNQKTGLMLKYQFKLTIACR